MKLFVGALFVAGNAIEIRESSELAKNPIRKVVTMLQNMQKKVTAEGEKEEELYEKFMCYCKTSGGDLDKSIAAAEAKVPEVTAAIGAGEANKKQLDADLVNHKKDREGAKAAMAEATALREKEAAAFATEKAEYTANGQAIGKAVAALEKGVAGSFLQSGAATVLRKLAQSSVQMQDADRQEIMSFLSADSQYSPQSGEIIGILKQLGDEMAAGLADSTAAEESSIQIYDEMMAAKTKEVGALTASIEEKTVRTGELAVSIVEMKNDLDDTATALEEDKKFMADLAANCDSKTAQWAGIQKTRAEEVVALADTIKVMNDDDALELFKKTLPSASASFVQMKQSSASIRARALSVIHAARNANSPARQQLDLIALALHGKAMGFEKVVKMIDEMVALLKKEQEDDDSKKGYCAKELDATDDNKKILERSISDSEAAIAEAEDSIATLVSEIKALEEGIKELDKSVATATENRKSENADFTDLIASNTAAKEVLAFATNRLNKFYNPKLYIAPAKRELSAEDKIVTSFGGTAAPTPAPGGIAGTGIAMAEISAHLQGEVAPPPPPETFGAYTTKGQETNGVIAMIDMLVKDLDKEMTTAEADEKDAQGDYEKMMSDSADKRASDSKSVAEKVGAKADTEAALQAHKGEKDSTTKELMGTLETIKALHGECDWLMQYFDVRKEARASEIESLGKAKAVLSGADFSLLQTRSRNFLGQ